MDQSDTDKQIIKDAVKNFKTAQEAYSAQRKSARDDLKFLAGEQRPSGVETFYQVNLLQPFLRQIVASAREANPAIEVVSTSSDNGVADIYSGIIRGIEQKCDAQLAYLTALWYAAAAGEGYILLDTEYVAPDSFDQEYVISAANNPEKVLLDPNHTLLDGCDAEWGFIVEDLSHGEFKRKFSKSKIIDKLESESGWKYLSLPSDWLSEDTIRVARYYEKTYELRTIYLYLDPLTLEHITKEDGPENHPDLTYLKKRESFDIVIKAYVLTAYEVLDETVWPGKYLPIIKVTGDSYTVGGQRVQHGAIRFAKDPQRQFNFHLTRKTEMIDLIPKVPFIAANGQVRNNPNDWANAHRNAVGTLTYEPTALGGQLVPPPSRPPGIDASAYGAIAQSQQDALEHLKLVFGMHGNPAMDQAMNDTSGVALEQRFDAAGRSVYQYFDNLLVSLRCVGRQLVDGIPVVYDADRMVRIVKPDDTDQIVAINSISNNQRYDLTKGTYDVNVKTGPAFSSRREKSLDASIKVLPLLSEGQRALTSDLFLRLIGDTTTNKMADRIKASQPPEILASTGEGDQEDLAPAEMVSQLQQQVAQMQMQLKTIELQKQELEVKCKLAEDKTAMELLKHDAEMEHKMAQLQQQDAVSELEGLLKKKELELTERQLEIKERELEISAALAQNKVLDGMKPIKDVVIPADSNIGGKI